MVRLDHVRPVKGLGDDFGIIPLGGHSPGHAGIAIRTQSGWLLHAGDAYMDHVELQPAPIGLSHFGWIHSIITDNKPSRKESLACLEELQLKYGDEVRIFWPMTGKSLKSA